MSASLMANRHTIHASISLPRMLTYISYCRRREGEHFHEVYRVLRSALAKWLICMLDRGHKCYWHRWGLFSVHIWLVNVAANIREYFLRWASSASVGFKAFSNTNVRTWRWFLGINVKKVHCIHYAQMENHRPYPQELFIFMRIGLILLKLSLNRNSLLLSYKSKKQFPRHSASAHQMAKQ